MDSSVSLKSYGNVSFSVRALFRVFLHASQHIQKKGGSENKRWGGNVYNYHVSTEPYASWQRNEDKPEREGGEGVNAVQATAVMAGGSGERNFKPVENSVTSVMLQSCRQSL